MSSAQERTAGYERGTGTQPGGAPRQSAGVPEQAAGYGQPGYQSDYEGGSMAAEGFTVLAATLMILGGLWEFFVGITAVIKQTFYLALPNYTFNLSIHAWGWTHLIIGALVVAAGVCLLLGMMWARVVGVVLAVISGLANFLFLPHYPIWSIIVIALDVFIIWALVSGGRRQVA
jgi:hypothetical protein